MTGERRNEVVIVNSYSYHNAGDAAIMLATAYLLKDLGFTSIALATRYEHETTEYERWGIETIPPLIPFSPRGRGPATRAVSFLLSAAATVMLVAFLTKVSQPEPARRRISRVFPATRRIIDADLVVIAGGGYLYSSRRKVNLSLLHSTLSMWLCGRLASKVISMPSSIGPVHRRIDRALIEAAYQRIRPVLRETESLEASTRKPSLPAGDLVPDIAFYGLRNSQSANANRQAAPSGVMMVCMDWTWSSSINSPDLADYVARMAELCRILTGRGHAVTLCGHSRIESQGQDDVAVCHRVAEEAGDTVRVDENSDVSHLVEGYMGADLVIGTRLHACILAASVGTPAIALAYQEKTVGVCTASPMPIPHFWVHTFDPKRVAERAELLIGRRLNDEASLIREALLDYYAGTILA